MLTRGDEGGQATVRNAGIARHCRCFSYELVTSLELAHCMRDSAVAYTQ